MTTLDPRAERAVDSAYGRRPTLTITKARGTTKAVILLLHGGSESNLEPVKRTKGSWLRMRWLQVAMTRRSRRASAETWLLRYRVRGWNPRPGSEPDPVRDARWALAQIRSRHPGVPIVLLGHSMGARTACRIANEESVVGVCALAPWLPPGEPIDAVRATSLVIAHGTADTWTSADASLDFARRARAAGARMARFELAGAGHFMVGQARTWHRLATGAALGLAGVATLRAEITAAMASAGTDGLRLVEASPHGGPQHR